MKIIADLQLHSRFSRATSKNTSSETLSEGAKIKGLNMLGTGDCLHPLWLKELKERLEPVDETGIYKYNDIFWMITGEVNTVYEQEKKIRKVHHLFYLPSFEVAEQLADKLSKTTNLSIDGRPTLNRMTSPEFVETVMEISKEAIILPSHVWTSWFGALGSKSGFDSLEECYQDQMKHIFALETGLSSDPPMNWRLSSLDKLTIMSNSDAHSPNPWRLGREANVFELDELSYKEIYDVIKKKDPKKFLYTIEVDPNYGKYHFTGHRKCGVSLHPKDALKINNKCPKCGGILTVGVLQRVEQLADREEGFVPNDAIPFKSLLPLYEIISYVTGVKQLYSKKVIDQQNRLISEFGNEMNVLLDVPKEDLMKITHGRIANAIVKVREGKTEYVPGYDGVYGEPIFEKGRLKEFFEKQSKDVDQKTISDFKGP